ncbi:MAG: putative polymerase [Jatrophihabitantaceae bacterium]|nr:putative polymerase [Jatrophihabitantaceae bacterium]
MGFQNPPMPWHELQRRLTGPDSTGPAPDAPYYFGQANGGDGGDSPAWSRKRAPYESTGPAQAVRTATPYAELHAHSSFSFLDGTGSPEQMAEEAARLGLEALAITDHDGFYGIVRFAEAAEALGLPTIFGAELGLDNPMPRTQAQRAVGSRAVVPDPPGTHLLALARGPAGYSSLSSAISTAQLAGGAKGHPIYDLEQLGAVADGRWLVLTGCRKGSVRRALDAGLAHRGTFALDPARRAVDELIAHFGRESIVVELTYALDPLADERYEALALLASEFRLPLVATTAAHYGDPSHRPLSTAMAAVRARRSLDEMDGWLPSFADQHLRSGEEVAARFARWPAAVPTAAALGRELAFELKLIAPNLPPFPVPPGHDEMSYLRQLAYEGAAAKYGPDYSSRRTSPGDRDRALAQIEHELGIIDQLGFPGYFLVVWAIVQYCKEENILCQGRGSAANSAVCFALGITAVDPVRYGLLFERFLSPDRDGPPDIDVDIESDRREEVIQDVYSRYGRLFTAQVANVITYRPRSAIRDVAKALGHAQGQQDAWSKQIEQGYYWVPLPPAETGGAPGDVNHGPGPNGEHAIPGPVLALAEQLQNTPRHLGIHSGGMVICDRPIIEVCPVEWGRMPGRTVLQWDKDDCATVGLVKFDLLGLGMLSALHYCFDFIDEQYGERYDLHDVPPEDPLVYDMLCRADSVGVFQVESRAQMATLPRLKPREFYDLVCEIALIRPGPIQGDSVHPFIRRRNGLEQPVSLHPLVDEVLRKTYGVPLFQEQLMQLAIAAAGCSPSEADQVRRAMGSKRSGIKMDAMRDRLYAGMAGNGITGAVADEIFEKIKAFAAFGFAESHAISFAFLVYASSWLKLYHPAAFCAALLNAQPMGFYSPQSLVHDARRHGVVIRPVDINASQAEASLEAIGADDQDAAAAAYDGPGPTQRALRIGLSSVRTISAELGAAMVAARDADGPFASMSDVSRRTGATSDHLEALATAGAFARLSRSPGLSRRSALWAAGAAAAHRPGQLPMPTHEAPPVLPEMSGAEQLMADLWSTGITDEYPTALIRGSLNDLGVTTNAALHDLPDRTRVLVGGIVTHRQRPATASGITFVNLEDETGMVNIVCHPVVWGRYRRIARDSAGLLVRGMLERTEGVINVIAETFERLPMAVRDGSRNFR